MKNYREYAQRIGRETMHDRKMRNAVWAHPTKKPFRLSKFQFWAIVGWLALLVFMFATEAVS